MIVRGQRIHHLVDNGGEPELVATGFTFVEGPVWNHMEQCLYFSDIVGNVRRRWSESDGVTDVRRPSNYCNGMTYDRSMRLLVCQHSTSDIVRESGDAVEVIASHYLGKELNSPNDLVVANDGSIFFTDPIFGRKAAFGVKRAQELSFQGLFRITPSGQLVLVDAAFNQPNGLCFSPDGSTLYVNDCVDNFIRAYPVRSDGSAGDGITLVEGFPGFDGMKCDEHGNIFITGEGGLLVFSPEGIQLGVLELPERAANMNWGGSDWRDLYVCASSSLYRFRMQVRGAPQPYMTDEG